MREPPRGYLSQTLAPQGREPGDGGGVMAGQAGPGAPEDDLLGAFGQLVDDCVSGYARQGVSEGLVRRIVEEALREALAAHGSPDDACFLPFARSVIQLRIAEQVPCQRPLGGSGPAADGSPS